MKDPCDDCPEHICPQHCRGVVGGLQGNLEMALVLLKEIEWSGQERNPPFSGHVCPVCNNHSLAGHAEGCKLAAMLREAE